MKIFNTPVSLVVEDLSIRYPSATENALDRVSLRVSGGEVVALAGPNGCGKTTLLRAACGILEPLTGRVWIPGTSGLVHRLPSDRRARWIGVVPQMEKLPPGYTAAEAVMLGRISFHGWFGPESVADRESVQSALSAVGLDGLDDRFVETLSGGGQQRVMIARTLAQEAPILLMDEPTAHLDVRHQMETLALLRGLAHEFRRAVLIVLHDLNLVSRFADRVALLERGRLIRCGPPSEVFTSETLSSLYAFPLQVIPHPERGFPLVLPDGDEPSADEYSVSASAVETTPGGENLRRHRKRG